MKNIAIIPARGGSKRIPHKNIKEFLGKPIIQYSIEAAVSSQCFDEVMVSTDDAQISEISKKVGAKVPFLRSKKNSDDYATLSDVVFEVLSEYKNVGKNFDYCCCILPTAVFVTSDKIKNGLDLLLKDNADSVIPVVRFGYPIQRAFKIENELLHMMYPENINKRSQDLEKAYHDSGQFYWVGVPVFMQQKKIILPNSRPLILPELEVQDIDSEEDWKIAELKYQIIMKNL